MGDLYVTSSCPKPRLQVLGSYIPMTTTSQTSAGQTAFTKNNATYVLQPLSSSDVGASKIVLTETANEPKVKLFNSYIPMNTVSSTTSDREYIEINNSTYIVESYYTHSESYLTTAEQSSGMSDVTALTRESTSGTSYLTEISTTGTSYLTSASSKSNVSATQLYLNTLKSIYRGVIGYSKTQYDMNPGIWTKTIYTLSPVQPGLSSTIYRNNEYYNSGTVNFQEVLVNYAATSHRATVYVQPIAVTTGTSYLTEEVTTGTSYLTCSSTSAYSGKSTSSNGNWE